MHKHVGHKLIKMEIAGHKEMETQQFVQVQTRTHKYVGG